MPSRGSGHEPHTRRPGLRHPEVAEASVPQRPACQVLGLPRVSLCVGSDRERASEAACAQPPSFLRTWGLASWWWYVPTESVARPCTSRSPFQGTSSPRTPGGSDRVLGEPAFIPCEDRASRHLCSRCGSASPSVPLIRTHFPRGTWPSETPTLLLGTWFRHLSSQTAAVSSLWIQISFSWI